jgi:probable phosphoglycerate mutase
MARILLVRHGESEWNSVGRWQGQADSPLSDLGRRQAKAATRALGPVDMVACSDLQRARVTAEIIASELGIGPVVVDPDLRERDAGEWSGLTRAEIHEQWPGYLPDDPMYRSATPPTEAKRPPGWEPEDHLRDRALRAVDRMAALVGDGDVLAVTHGGLIYALETHLDEPWHRIPNLGGRWFEAVDGRLELGERVMLVDPHDVAVTTPDQI